MVVVIISQQTISFVLILLLAYGRSEKDYVKQLHLEPIEFPRVGRCSLDIDLERRQLFARSDNGTHLQIFPASTHDEAWPSPQLCFHNRSSSIAVLTIASDVIYMRNFEGFAWNKICFCTKANLQFMLFLGKVPEALNAPSNTCKTHRASSHWIKNIAMYTALFAFEESPEEILVLDTDAIFTKPSFSADRFMLIDCYRAIASDYNFSLFAGVEHYQVFLNAAVLFAKKTSWTKALLSLWWRDRCGDKDQLVLWSSLFRLWSLEEARLAHYNDTLLDYVQRGNYRKAAHQHENNNNSTKNIKNATYMYARRVLTFELARNAFPHNFIANRSPSGRIMLKETDLLSFPHFIFFPITKLKASFYRKHRSLCPRDVPPFRGISHHRHHDPKMNENDFHRAAFIAHTKHTPKFDACPSRYNFTTAAAGKSPNLHLTSPSSSFLP